METFPNHLKRIAYLLAILILFQSCIIYRKKPSTIEQASSKENTHIKLITKTGDLYKLKWIEERDNAVYSVIDTKRVLVKKKRVSHYLIHNPNPVLVPLEEAEKYDGVVCIYVGSKSSSYRDSNPTHKLINIEDEGEYIRGLKITGIDTASVVIPLDQIETIQLINEDVSVGIPFLISIVAIAAGFGLIIIIGMSM